MSDRRRSRSRESENVFKLHSRGLPMEFISSSLGLPVEDVKMKLESHGTEAPVYNELVGKSLLRVLTVQDLSEMHYLQGPELENEVRKCQRDPEFYLRYIQAIRLRCQKYSGRRRWQVLELKKNPGLAKCPLIYDLKAEAQAFSISILRELSYCLTLNLLANETLELTAELLSILDPAIELACFVAVFRQLDKSKLTQLLLQYMLHGSQPLEKLTALQTAWLAKAEVDLVLVWLTQFLCTAYLDRQDLEACTRCFLACFSQIERTEIRPEALHLAGLIGEKLQLPQLLKLLSVLKTQRLSALEAWHLAGLQMRATELWTESGQMTEADLCIAEMKANWHEDVRFKTWLLNYSVKYASKDYGRDFYESSIEANLRGCAEAGLPEVLTEALTYVLQLIRLNHEDCKGGQTDNQSKLKSIGKKVKEHELALSQRSFTAELEAIRTTENRRLKVLQEEKLEANMTMLDDTLPPFIYSTMRSTNQLYATDLKTDAESVHEVEGAEFNIGCQYVQLPDTNCLIFTGGGPSNNVLHISPDFSSAALQPLLTGRYWHGSVYYGGYVYVMGGKRNKKSYLSSCERYSMDSQAWEEIAELPRPLSQLCPEVIERTECIYVVSGYFKAWLDNVLEYNISTAQWQTLDVVLPLFGSNVISFKWGREATAVLYCVKTRLFSFKTQDRTVTELKRLKEAPVNQGGPSYFSRGVLYCSNDMGFAHKYSVGNILTD